MPSMSACICLHPSICSDPSVYTAFRHTGVYTASRHTERGRRRAPRAWLAQKHDGSRKMRQRAPLARILSPPTQQFVPSPSAAHCPLHHCRLCSMVRTSSASAYCACARARAPVQTLPRINMLLCWHAGMQEAWRHGGMLAWRHASMERQRGHGNKTT